MGPDVDQVDGAVSLDSVRKTTTVSGAGVPEVVVGHTRTIVGRSDRMRPVGESTERWQEVADLFSVRLGDVDADQWTAPTPCAERNVRELVEHAVGYQTGYLRALGEDADVVSEFDDDPIGDG